MPSPQSPIFVWWDFDKGKVWANLCYLRFKIAHQQLQSIQGLALASISMNLWPMAPQSRHPWGRITSSVQYHLLDLFIWSSMSIQHNASTDDNTSTVMSFPVSDVCRIFVENWFQINRHPESLLTLNWLTWVKNTIPIALLSKPCIHCITVNNISSGVYVTGTRNPGQQASTPTFAQLPGLRLQYYLFSALV